MDKPVEELVAAPVVVAEEAGIDQRGRGKAVYGSAGIAESKVID